MTVTVTAGAVAGKLEEILAIVSNLNPTVALAYSTFEELKALFGSNSELNALLKLAYDETAETAPAVAQQVSDWYDREGGSMEQSFLDHPGK